MSGDVSRHVDPIHLLGVLSVGGAKEKAGMRLLAEGETPSASRLREETSGSKGVVHPYATVAPRHQQLLLLLYRGPPSTGVLAAVPMSLPHNCSYGRSYGGCRTEGTCLDQRQTQTPHLCN